jgi:hypothetical protein
MSESTMKLLRWVLIVAGSLVVLLVAAGIGGYFYVVSGPSLELSVKDWEIGSPWPPTERAAFVSSCLKTSGSAHRERTPVFCECVTKEAETKISRVGRLMIAADFEDNWRQMAKVVLAAGWLLVTTDKSIDDGLGVSESLNRDCAKLRG